MDNARDCTPVRVRPDGVLSPYVRSGAPVIIRYYFSGESPNL